MPIFHLKPVAAGFDDPAWGNSPYHGELWVNAVDEAEARGLAAGRYDDANATIPGVRSSPSPWLDARLVSVTAEATGPGGVPIPAGVVLGEQQM